MNNELSEILKDCLVIPYSSELIERLQSLCNQYAVSHNIDDNWVARRAILLFSNQKEQSLKKELETAYEDMFGDKVVLPLIVVNALIVYIICQAIDGMYEDADAEFCSMSLMNCVILLNENYGSMPFAKILVGGYGKLQSYMKDTAKNFEVDVEPFSEKLFVDTPQQLISKGFDEDNIKVCKKLAVDAWKYNTIKFLEQYREKSNSYYDYYVVISKIINSIPHIYIYLDVDAVLAYLDNEYDEEECKMISEIFKELINKGVSVESYECESSIILRSLRKDKLVCNLNFMLSKLSKHDFGVYLYYELLMEKIAANGTE